MKLFIVALLLTFACFAQANTVTDAEDFLRGLVRGSLGSVGEDIVGCIHDGEEIFFDVINVAQNFEKAVVHGNKAAFEEGLERIGNIVTLLPTEVKECRSAAGAVKSLEKIIVEFTNPTALVVDVGKKIIWHGRSIFKDVRKTVSDLKAKDYEDAGKNIGDLIKILFLNNLRNPLDDTTVLLTTFYNAAFKLDLDLATCEGELQESVDEITEGIHGVLNFTSIDSVVQGFMKAYNGAKDLYHGAQDCETAWPVLKEGVQRLAPFYEHPLNILTAAPSAYASHPIAMTKDLNNLRKALTSHPIDFSKTGLSTGDIVKLVLSKM